VPVLYAGFRERDGWLDHPCCTQGNISRQAGIADTNNGTGGIFNTKDDHTACSIVRDPTHAHGNINRARSTTLKFDRCCLSTSNELPERWFIHGCTSACVGILKEKPCT